MAKHNNRQREVSILVTGDVCPVYQVAQPLKKGKIQQVFRNTLGLFLNVDLAVLNLEAPLTRSKKAIIKCGPNLKADPALAPVLRQVGFSVASLANNHIRDFGSEGVTDTVKVLSENGFPCFGVGPDAARASAPLFLSRQGVRLALIGLTENEFANVDENQPGWGAAPMSPVENCEVIAAAARKADVVLVFVHGGNEYCPFPSPRMVQLYRAYVRAGASAVIGSHTHVPQGYEIYKGSPIFYSLGNFLFPWKTPSFSEFWYRGIAAKLTFKSGKLARLNITPVQADKVTGALECITSPELEQFNRYYADLCALIASNDRLKKAWLGWCARRGHEGWLNRLKPETTTPRKPADYQPLALCENMIRCEAHREMGLTYLNLVRNKTLGAARKYIPEVEKLMKGYFK